MLVLALNQTEYPSLMATLGRPLTIVYTAVFSPSLSRCSLWKPIFFSLE